MAFGGLPQPIVKHAQLDPATAPAAVNELAAWGLLN